MYVWDAPLHTLPEPAQGPSSPSAEEQKTLQGFLVQQDTEGKRELPAYILTQASQTRI